MLSYHLCIHWSITFDFLQEHFLCIHNLATWYKRPSFWPSTCLPHYALSFLAFDLSEKYMTFLLTWTLRGHFRITNWLKFNIIVSQRRSWPRRGNETGNGWSVEKSECIQYLSIKLAVLYGCGSWDPNAITILTWNITDHRLPSQI